MISCTSESSNIFSSSTPKTLPDIHALRQWKEEQLLVQYLPVL